MAIHCTLVGDDKVGSSLERKLREDAHMVTSTG